MYVCVPINEVIDRKNTQTGHRQCCSTMRRSQHRMVWKWNTGMEDCSRPYSSPCLRRTSFVFRPARVVRPISALQIPPTTLAQKRNFRPVIPATDTTQLVTAQRQAFAETQISLHLFGDYPDRFLAAHHGFLSAPANWAENQSMPSSRRTAQKFQSFWTISLLLMGFPVEARGSARRWRARQSGNGWNGRRRGAFPDSPWPPGWPGGGWRWPWRPWRRPDIGRR